MAEKDGQVLETEEQTDPSDQVLDGGKQTDPQTGEDEEIDVTKNLGKRFVISPKRPDLTMSGEELRNAVGRAKLVDNLQSELHKAQERAKELEAQAEQTRKENDLLRLIRESRSSAPEPEEDVEDVFNFDETPPKIDPKVVRQQIEPDLNEAKTKMTALEKQMQELSERERQREEKLAYQQFGEQVRTAEEISLRKEFPTLSDAEIKEMVGNMDAIDNLTTQAIAASQSGDRETAWERKLEARERQAYLTELRTKASAKQRQANERQRAKEQLETKSTTDVVKPDILKRPAKNPKEAKEKEEAMKKYIADQAKARRLLRNVAG